MSELFNTKYCVEFNGSDRSCVIVRSIVHICCTSLLYGTSSGEYHSSLDKESNVCRVTLDPDQGTIKR